MRSLDPDPVATFEIQRGRFVREVEGRGTLKAVKATPIVAPIESGRPQKIAFLAKDGAVVAAGETVVEFDPYDAREGGGGRARRPHRGAGEDRQGGGGRPQERALPHPRPRRGPGRARPGRDLRAHRRVPLHPSPDHRVAARQGALRRPAPTWRGRSSTPAGSSPPPSGSWATSTPARPGSSSTSPRRACARCGSPPLTTGSWSSSGTGGERRPSWATRSGPARRSPSSPSSRSWRRRSSCWRPTGRG